MYCFNFYIHVCWSYCYYRIGMCVGVSVHMCVWGECTHVCGGECTHVWSWVSVCSMFVYVWTQLNPTLFLLAPLQSPLFQVVLLADKREWHWGTNTCSIYLPGKSVMPKVMWHWGPSQLAPCFPPCNRYALTLATGYLFTRFWQKAKRRWKHLA